MDKKQNIILDIKRVAERLSSQRLSQKDYLAHGKFTMGIISNTFGSWDRAAQAAGIHSYKGFIPKRKEISDKELLKAIVDLARQLHKHPTGREMNAMGKFSERPYRKRWGSFERARDIALSNTTFFSEDSFVTKDTETDFLKQVVTPTIKPKIEKGRKKVQFGEPIDFRGLRFAPVNEQGVVYLFGMISKELGFLIESIRTEYPDCEGKRCVDEKNSRWEHVLIEFEYKSSQFQEHSHKPEDCDLIVCWIHDWEECPVEVLELRSTIKLLG